MSDPFHDADPFRDAHLVRLAAAAYRAARDAAHSHDEAAVVLVVVTAPSTPGQVHIVSAHQLSQSAAADVLATAARQQCAGSDPALCN